MQQKTSMIFVSVLVLIITIGAEIIPNPIISRGKPVFTNVDVGNAKLLTDGKYDGDDTSKTWHGGIPSSSEPAWTAIKVGAGPSSLLCTWVSLPNRPKGYISNYGAAGDYTVQTSSNSTNGSDGDWETIITVSDNCVSTREHRFVFSGKSWVKLRFTAKSKYSLIGIQINEIELFDASNGAEDTWAFIGNSITTGAFSGPQPSFAENINSIHSKNFPLMMMDMGQVGDLSCDGVGSIALKVNLNPDIKFWGIEYGTNDGWTKKIGPDSFMVNMQTIISAIINAGHVPILAHIGWNDAWTNIPEYNARVDTLIRRNSLMAGPDFYAYFKDHPGEIGDGVHPNATGYLSMNRLWAQAMDSLYALPVMVLSMQPPTAKNRTQLQMEQIFSMGNIAAFDKFGLNGRCIPLSSQKTSSPKIYLVKNAPYYEPKSLH
jgi:acyl-CoA thioesterase I